MPGYFPSIASATMLPISDSCSRVGSRRMSLACVPITWLRRSGLRVGVVDDRLDVRTSP